MTAHVVVLATPNPDDTDAMTAYGAGVQPLLTSAGAKIVFRGPVAATLAGGNPPAVIAVLEFANAELARGFFSQEAYLKLLPHREKGFSRLEIFQVG